MRVVVFLDRYLAHAKADLRPNTNRLYAGMVNKHVRPHLKTEGRKATGTR
jgi:hypothetical protein